MRYAALTSSVWGGIDERMHSLTHWWQHAHEQGCNGGTQCAAALFLNLNASLQHLGVRETAGTNGLFDDLLGDFQILPRCSMWVIPYILQ